MKLRKIFFTMLAAALFICVSPRMSAYATSYTVPAGETGPLGDLTNPPSSPASITLFSGDTLTIGSGAELTIDFNDTLTIEQGASVNNSGVIINNGTIINRGTMSNASGAELRNQALGVIDNNTVAIANNKGKVTNNNGTINGNTGTVTNNFGTVDQNTGTVTNNFGTVNNTGGTVTNNFGGRVDSDFAENYYYQVTVTNGDHTTNTLTVENNQLWLLSGGSATFTPQPGYVITNAVSDNPKAAFTSSNGVWTLTDDGTNTAATAVTLTVEELPAPAVPHTGSDRQTVLMLSLALLSGAVLLSGVISRKKRA